MCIGKVCRAANFSGTARTLVCFLAAITVKTSTRVSAVLRIYSDGVQSECLFRSCLGFVFAVDDIVSANELWSLSHPKSYNAVAGASMVDQLQTLHRTYPELNHCVSWTCLYSLRVSSHLSAPEASSCCIPNHKAAFFQLPLLLATVELCSVLPYLQITGGNQTCSSVMDITRHLGPS